jgi:hypothetical protein
LHHEIDIDLKAQEHNQKSEVLKKLSGLSKDGEIKVSHADTHYWKRLQLASAYIYEREEFPIVITGSQPP